MVTGYYYTVKGPSKYPTLSTIPKAVVRIFERALRSILKLVHEIFLYKCAVQDIFAPGPRP
jgi:hypothetical protein